MARRIPDLAPGTNGWNVTGTLSIDIEFGAFGEPVALVFSRVIIADALEASDLLSDEHPIDWAREFARASSIRGRRIA